jgi:hypothetical protein
MIFILFAFGLFGLIASAALFRHQRLLTFVAAAAALCEAAFLLAGFIHRIFLPAIAVDQFYTFASFLVVAAALLFIRQVQLVSIFSWRRFFSDLVILPVVGITLASACIISSANYQQGSAWVTHGFFNGDTLTLVSLAQRSTLQPGLLAQNPLAANGSLEYPTLLHGTIADLLQLSHAPWNWFSSLPLYTFIQIAIIVPLFFLLWDIALPEPKQPWQMWLGISSRTVILIIQALIVLGVMMLSWDNFIYPQSHFFLFAIFLMGLAALAVSSSNSGKSQWPPFMVGAICFLLLYVANAVTGTAALALLAVLCLIRVTTISLPIFQRIIYLILFISCAVWFFAWTPGQSDFGHLKFSYVAAYDMLRLSPIVLFVLIAGWITKGRQKFLALGAIALTGMSVALFFLSGRNIIVENASRFLYHAIVVGFPLTLPLILQAYFWLRRQLQFTTQTWLETLFGYAATVIAFILFAVIPAGGAVISAHDNLTYNDTQRVDSSTIEALHWLYDNTPAAAVIVASPQPPWSVPFFTGRSLLRLSDYWLSPQDETLNMLKAAFTGDKKAQAGIVTQGDYLLLQHHEETLWGKITYPKVFSNDTVAIYNLHAGER